MSQVSLELRQWLDQFNPMMADLLAKGFKATPTNAREGLATLTFGLVTERPEIAWVQDDLVAAGASGYTVPVRIYHPAPEIELPVLIYYHGGGHMAGSVTIYDLICRKLAQAARHIVVSVDYRLAPECPYPAGLTDAVQVAKNLWATLDGRRLNYQRQLAMAGDSGGGALCASVAHLAQYDAGVEIQRQVLIYPSLDYTMSLPSVAENGTGYLLERERIAWYFDNYFQRCEDRKSASPLFMAFSAALPETLVVTAQFCPLRDEGAAYAAKVDAAGPYVEYLHLDDMIHAFLNMENLAKTACTTVYRRIAEFLNRDRTEATADI
jgi:acetyl esterase/lipase